MRPLYFFRLRRAPIVIILIVVVIVYVAFIGHQTSQKYVSPTILVRPEKKDPYRFKLPHAWAWNDDVIYLEERNDVTNIANLTAQLRKEAGRVLQNKTSHNKSPSPLQDRNSDYVQSRYLGVEGVEDYILSKDDYREPRIPRHTRKRKCSHPVNNIIFLKTHHTGSDVITNILNRYADLRDLKVAIPSGGVSTFYWPARFHWRHLDLSIVDGILPNILCNHARYNPDIMDQIMPPGTAYVTILSHPQSNFEAIFRNEDFMTLLEMYEYSDPIGSFLENPKMHIQRVIKRNRFKDTLNLIKNGMFFDLGLRTADYHKPKIVKDAILDMDDKFTVVLIHEYLDESLVLMKRKLCWELDDVLYLKSYFTKRETLKDYTPDELESLRKWNKADFSLYEHFNRSLWQQIGFEKDFFQELRQFREKQREIEEDCLEYLITTAVPRDLGSSNTHMNKYFCYKMTLTTGGYLEYFRAKFTAKRH